MEGKFLSIESSEVGTLLHSTHSWDRQTIADPLSLLTYTKTYRRIILQHLNKPIHLEDK